jgi:hypothetical protein
LPSRVVITPKLDNAKLCIAWRLPAQFNYFSNEWMMPSSNYVLNPEPLSPLVRDKTDQKNYGWRSVCLPNEDINDINSLRRRTPGVKPYQRDYKLIYCPIKLPKNVTPKMPFHLKEVKFSITLSAVKSIHPVSFTIPVKPMKKG